MEIHELLCPWLPLRVRVRVRIRVSFMPLMSFHGFSPFFVCVVLTGNPSNQGWV